MKKELLAPAGDIEAGYAALYYGADAVYLGLQKFSARATATNFDEKSLGEFTAYAHSIGRKVYVTVNTVVQEKELSELIEALDICVKTGVDALIIQDLGVARIVRENYPELEMHASTQMAVHNKEGALALQKLGFTRVVVARELGRKEIEEIAAIPGLETEAFVHGALCYSYSGLCMFSSMHSGKSANRGKCLYPCRAEFKDEQGNIRHFFSMKDMALEEDVLKMPAFSLKIEGRKKTALYVAAVTDYYRRILDGAKNDVKRAQNIKQIFSRPWCRFHFNGRNKNIVDRDFVGHRGLYIGTLEQVSARSICFRTNHLIEKHDGIQIDVPGVEKPFGFSVLKMRVNGKNVFEAKPPELVEITVPPHEYKLDKGFRVYLASASSVKGAYPYKKPKPGEYCPRLGINVEVMLEDTRVIATSGEAKAEINVQLDKAKDVEGVLTAIEKAFSKTGDTNLSLDKLTVQNDKGLFAPMSLLNELRRNLYQQIKPIFETRKLPEYATSRQVSKVPEWIIKTDDVSVLTDINLQDVAEVVIAISPESKPEQWKNIPKEKLRLSLPAVCRNFSSFEGKIAELLKLGYKKWEVANYWGCTALARENIDLSFDYEIYIFNTQAAAMAQNMGCNRITLSPEDMMENWQILAKNSSVAVVLPIYEDVALFTSAVCIRDETCQNCNHERKEIKLRRGSEDYIAISENCQTVMLNNQAWCIANQAKKVAADFYRVAFMRKKYNPSQAAALWEKLRQFKSIPNTQQANVVRQI